MSKYMLRIGTSLAIALSVAASACSGDKKPDTLAQDTSLNADLQLANRDTAAQPALSDVPATAAPAPAPATSQPAPTVGPGASTRPAPARTTTRTPARTTTRTPTATAPRTGTTASGNTVTRTPGASAATVGTIPAGADISMSAGSRICTNTNSVGDRFSATVRESVSGSNGAVIPAGATAQVEITALKRSENANDNVTMGFRVVSFTFGGRTYPVSATTTYAQVDKIKNQPRNKDIQKVATGAAVGAILGQVLGKDTRSTVIGGAAGAAAGTAAAAATSNFEGCVPSGGRITVNLNSATQVNI